MAMAALTAGLISRLRFSKDGSTCSTCSFHISYFVSSNNFMLFPTLRYLARVWTDNGSFHLHVPFLGGSTESANITHEQWYSWNRHYYIVYFTSSLSWPVTQLGWHKFSSHLLIEMYSSRKQGLSSCMVTPIPTQTHSWLYKKKINKFHISTLIQLNQA